MSVREQVLEEGYCERSRGVKFVATSFAVDWRQYFLSCWRPMVIEDGSRGRRLLTGLATSGGMQRVMNAQPQFIASFAAEPGSYQLPGREVMKQGVV